MHDVLRFWLDRGVDGFRIDAVGCLAKDPALRDDPPNPDFHPGDPPFARNLMVNSANGPDIMDFVGGIRRVVEVYPREPVLIGEVYLKTGEIALYYGAELGGLQLPTNFNLLWTPWKAEPILEVIAAYEAVLPAGRLARLGDGKSRPVAHREPPRASASPHRDGVAADAARHAHPLLRR